MQNFQQLFRGIDPAPALAEIDAQPELWGADTARTAAPNSPHAQSQDIFLRFRAKSELQDPDDYGAPHFAEFWPAWSKLPALHPIVFNLMRQVSAVYLGGILMTRIPAGAAILSHVDRGWHPEFMNRKAYVILRANAACINFCGGEVAVMEPGSAWLFRNDIEHSVENRGQTERIAMIVTMRTEG